MTSSRAAAKTICNLGSSQSAVVDHFDAFCSGRRADEKTGLKGRRSSLKKTPTKRKASSFTTPTKSEGKKTPRKTPKKDVFSPAARKILDRAKGVLTSPRKSTASSRLSSNSKSHCNSARKSESVQSQQRQQESDPKTQAAAIKTASSGSANQAPKTSGAAHQAEKQSDKDSCSNTPGDKEKESRSERNKAKLKEICLVTLKERGVMRTDPIFANCFSRLYTISKSFVKDLKTSLNLREAMRKIAESNVDLIVSFEKGRV